MNCKNLFTGCVLLLLVLGVDVFHSRAQVHPKEISDKRLKKSLKAVLGVQKIERWYHVTLSDSLKKNFNSRLRRPSALSDTLYVGVAKKSDKSFYVIPAVAPSRSEVFSFLLYLTPDKKIHGVDVLAYRENYGYEIDYQMFRKQFRGISQPGNIRFQGTIRNISGATISARSLTFAVHDLMVIVNAVGLKKEET